ncbi:uncharacterized protein LOC123708460 [Pieris brassicae]|uniref:uncharacterized protein LOC123708460 n=1 Tax=Pieris brassicae TaxID=7116 RepID=UPI001E65E858|nr:uncharacterized protein LOC123708460 [Pieris brassicae]
MPLFESLPRLEKCCCFTLRTGSIIFAVLGIFSCLHLFDVLSPCSGEKTYMKFFKFIWAVSELMVFGASIIFLIGICCHRKRITATVFLSTTAISIVVSLGMGIMGTVEFIAKNNCFSAYHLLSWFMNIPAGIFCMLVVRSYRDSMED